MFYFMSLTVFHILALLQRMFAHSPPLDLWSAHLAYIYNNRIYENILVINPNKSQAPYFWKKSRISRRSRRNVGRKRRAIKIAWKLTSLQFELSSSWCHKKGFRILLLWWNFYFVKKIHWLSFIMEIFVYLFM